MSPFYNDRVFGTREELMDWVQSTARNLGYVIVTQRTKKTVIGFVNKVYLMCDRGGEYKSRSQSTTHSGTKKCGCPFQLIAKYNHNPTHSGWNINVICDEHNHDPAIFLEGHAFAKRFSKKEFEIVKDMTNKNMVPRDILTQLKKNDDQNVSTTQTVYDARQKIRKAERVGQTPMQNRKWLRSKLIDKQDVFTYLDANWLQKYKEKFVSAWIDQNLNFGERTTNRVESQHSLLKIHLDNERSHLDKFIGIIDDIVRIQYTEIKASFGESMNKIKHLYRNRTFSLLLTKVSIETIDVLTGEMHRVKSLKQKEESCGCQIRTSCGLPCACEISQYVDVDLSIPLHMINVFWKKLDFEPALLNQEEPNEPDDPDTDIREQLHDFEEAYNNKNRAVVKKSWLQKIKAIWDPSSTSCGFWATASALGYGEDQWLLIRRLLIDEMVQFETHYKKAFKDEYNEVFSSLEWSGPGFAPHEYWMIMPETGFLIANRFNVVCHFISTEGNNSSTLFPLWRGPDQFPDKKIITIALVNSNHYVMVEMQDEFPMSLTHNLWRLRRERDATGWKNIFKSRQKLYKDWVAKSAKYEVID